MTYITEKFLYNLFSQRLQESTTKISDVAKLKQAAMTSLRNYITKTLEEKCPNMFKTGVSTSRHPQEIIRIDVVNLQYDANTITEKLQTEIFTEQVGNEYVCRIVGIEDTPEIVFKTDLQLIPQVSSGSYASYVIHIIDENNDKELGIAYITNCKATVGKKSGFGKKIFTPNNVLPKEAFQVGGCTASTIINKIEYNKDLRIQALLNALTEDTKNATINNKSLITFLQTPDKKGVSLNGTDLQITVPLDVTKKVIQEQSFTDEELDKLKASIYVDFGEVLGALSLATVLQKEDPLLIEFPVQSNLALIDYKITSKEKDITKEFKVSAKSGAGGKPTLNTPCSSILGMVQRNKELQEGKYKDTVDFVKWIQSCLGKENGTEQVISEAKKYAKVSVHDSFANMAKYVIQLANGEITDSFLTNTDQYEKLTSQFENIQEIDTLEPTQENLIVLVRKTNSIIEYIFSVDNTKGSKKGLAFIQEKGVWGNEATDETGRKKLTAVKIEQYFESLKIKCLVTILINIINNSDLIEKFNELFNLCYGTFIQIYINDKHGFDVLEFNGVLKSIDGQDIIGTGAYYKLVFDCNIDSGTGTFKTKSLAMKLMRESKEFKKQLYRLQEKYNSRLVLQDLFEEIIDFCSSKQLNEETAQKYFRFLMNEGLKEINFSQQGNTLDAELDYANTVLRYNVQVKDKNIKNNYFEGDNLETFKSKFLKFLQSQENINKDAKLRAHILATFNNYYNLFKLKAKQLEAKWVGKE